MRLLESHFCMENATRSAFRHEFCRALSHPHVQQDQEMAKPFFPVSSKGAITLSSLSMFDPPQLFMKFHEIKCLQVLSSKKPSLCRPCRCDRHLPVLVGCRFFGSYTCNEGHVTNFRAVGFALHMALKESPLTPKCTVGIWIDVIFISSSMQAGSIGFFRTLKPDNIFLPACFHGGPLVSAVMTSTSSHWPTIPQSPAQQRRTPNYGTKALKAAITNCDENQWKLKTYERQQ